MSGIKALKQKIQEDKLKSGVSNIELTKQTGTPLDAKAPSGRPVENPEIVTDTLMMMHQKAMENAINAESDGYNIKVSDLQKRDIEGETVISFSIMDGNNTSGKNDYMIYLIGDTIYYRPYKEFIQIIANIDDKVPGSSISSLKNKYDKIREPLPTSYNVTYRDDCAFVICSIFSSITGKSYDNDLLIDRVVDESCKIRKNTKLGTDYNKKKSVMFHDAKYGDAEKKEFKQEIEDKQKIDGTVGSLDQAQQQESESGPNIPNVHKMISERFGLNVDALLEARAEDIYYEPLDRVIVKIDGEEMPGRVTAVYDDIDGKQVVTVLSMGRTYNVKSKDLKPDLAYLYNRLMDTTDEYSDLVFNIDWKTGLPYPLKNDTKDYSKEYQDLNESYLPCDILSEGFKCNYDRCYANLRDIAMSSDYIHVVNENGVLDIWPKDNVYISQENWPYAVICKEGDDDNEPVRKIRINPQSYIEASDEDMVDCLLNDEPTQIIKKVIKIIS